MSNEFLKRLYERYPGKWKWQFQQTINGKGVWVDATAGCPPNKPQRLRPILPEGLPEPPAETFAYGPEQPGGYPLGYGLKRGYKQQTFSGWVYCKDRHEKGWGRCEAIFFNLSTHYYILDLRDEHAEAIIAANGGGESKYTSIPRGPCDIHSEKEDKADGVAGRLWDALIALGWTPPGESEWVTLDQFDWEFYNGREWRQAYTLDVIRNMASVEGASSVRVRKRSGS